MADFNHLQVRLQIQYHVFHLLLILNTFQDELDPAPWNTNPP